MGGARRDGSTPRGSDTPRGRNDTLRREAGDEEASSDDDDDDAMFDDDGGELLGDWGDEDGADASSLAPRNGAARRRLSPAERARRKRQLEVRDQRRALHVLTTAPRASAANNNIAERPVAHLELVERLADAALYCMDVEDWQAGAMHAMADAVCTWYDIMRSRPAGCPSWGGPAAHLETPSQPLQGLSLALSLMAVMRSTRTASPPMPTWPVATHPTLTVCVRILSGAAQGGAEGPDGVSAAAAATREARAGDAGGGGAHADGLGDGGGAGAVRGHAGAVTHRGGRSRVHHQSGDGHAT